MNYDPMNAESENEENEDVQEGENTNGQNGRIRNLCDGEDELQD